MRYIRDIAMVYLGAGLFCGLLISAAIPAMNAIGVAYIVASWPAAIYCAPKSRGCDAMPTDWMGKYMFSFPAKEGE